MFCNISGEVKLCGILSHVQDSLSLRIGYVHIPLYLEWIETHRNLPVTTTEQTTSASVKTSFHTGSTIRPTTLSPTPSTTLQSSLDPTTVAVTTPKTNASWNTTVEESSFVVAAAAVVFVLCK